MSEFADRLGALLPKLIDVTSYRLARGERLRADIAEQVARFYDHLLYAVDIGSPQWLERCLDEWVSAGSGGIMGERPTILPVLDVIKAATWDTLRDNTPAQETLELIVALEPAFRHAWMYLSGLEAENLMAQASARLAEAEDHMRQLDKSKSDFISVAAHELKTPLTLIEGYSMMLGEQLPHGEASPHDGLVRGIAKGIDRLREIVDDLIDVSALETNMVSLSYQPVRLLRVFDRAKSELAEVLATRRLTMVIGEFDNEATLTQADPQRMLQVARKVVGNAVKYTPDGGRITISARQLPAFVEVLVADSGIGIAPEQVQGIFEKFGQAGDVALHSTGKTKFKGGGTGLSLHIVKGILERHGGSIWCESPGHDERTCPGSTFHLLIPLRDGPPPP